MAQTLWDTDALLQWQLKARWNHLVHLRCISNANKSHPVTQGSNVGFYLREAELLPWLQWLERVGQWVGKLLSETSSPGVHRNVDWEWWAPSEQVLWLV